MRLSWKVLRGSVPLAEGSVGVVLHELSPQTGSLEDAFLKATADSVEYHSGNAGHGGGAA